MLHNVCLDTNKIPSESSGFSRAPLTIITFLIDLTSTKKKMKKQSASSSDTQIVFRWCLFLGSFLINYRFVSFRNRYSTRNRNCKTNLDVSLWKNARKISNIVAINVIRPSIGFFFVGVERHVCRGQRKNRNYCIFI